MLFNSLSFAVFFPIVFLLYWFLPHKYRWLFLLAASYYFYMSWSPKYMLLILFTTFVSYFSSIALERADNPAVKKGILGIGIAACLLVLFYFKYFGFFLQSIESVMKLFSMSLHPVTLHIMLPVGISFYTFQTLGYMIDVYRGALPAERHFGKYALFVSYFPQLVAGPIERSKNLLPQVQKIQVFQYDKAVNGILLMLWGFFKKIAIADSLAFYTDLVYRDVSSYHGLALIVAAVFFTLQIYCDFSGYSDIAIGSSKLLGIDLMTNFKSPFFVTSIKAYWAHWHISLSSWFRDYVYIPLGGNRVRKSRHYFNTFFTFMLSGLWHGANWTFVFWGFLHGTYIIIGDLLRTYTKLPLYPQEKGRDRGCRKGIYWWISAGVTFSLIAAAYVAFRSNTLEDAFYVLTHLFTGILSPVTYIKEGYQSLQLGMGGFITLLLPISLLFLFDYLSLKMDVIARVRMLPPIGKWILYWLLLLVVFYFSISNTDQAFIYFQF